ncbi:hypothetical protein ATO13_08626 [Stappia sp. 22II-S9-Z10]|nr:hypothetical protein ATO13_08626 [Stappia sp. 22II-S9-Z10]
MIVTYDDIEEVVRECAEGWREVMAQTGPCYHFYETCGSVRVFHADGRLEEGWRFGMTMQALPEPRDLLAIAGKEWRGEFEAYMVRLTRRGTLDAFIAVLEEGPKDPNDVDFFMRLAAAARGEAVDTAAE